MSTPLSCSEIGPKSSDSIHLPWRRISDWLVLLSLSWWWSKCHTSLDRAQSKRLSTEDSAVEIYSHKALSRPRGCLSSFSLKLKDMGNLRDDTLHRKSTKIPRFFHHLNFKKEYLKEGKNEQQLDQVQSDACISKNAVAFWFFDAVPPQPAKLGFTNSFELGLLSAFRQGSWLILVSIHDIEYIEIQGVQFLDGCSRYIDEVTAAALPTYGPNRM